MAPRPIQVEQPDDISDEALADPPFERKAKFCRVVWGGTAVTSN